MHYYVENEYCFAKNPTSTTLYLEEQGIRYLPKVVNRTKTKSLVTDNFTKGENSALVPLKIKNKRSCLLSIRKHWDQI